MIFHDNEPLEDHDLDRYCIGHSLRSSLISFFRGFKLPADENPADRYPTDTHAAFIPHDRVVAIRPVSQNNSVANSTPCCYVTILPSAPKLATTTTGKVTP